MPKRTHVNHALKQANRAAKQGDLVAAERWSKLAERITTAAASSRWDAPEDQSAEAEALRAELLRKLEAARDVRDEARREYDRVMSGEGISGEA